MPTVKVRMGEVILISIDPCQKFNPEKTILWRGSVLRKAMGLALSEAEKGLGKVSPNPMVGAVIIKDKKIVGKAFHKRFGGLHAEAELIESLPEKIIKNATLVVNLEPCSHYGKTPPCSLLIADKGIKKVVISTKDPNPLVSGKGIRCLEDRGIHVVKGICREEALELNRGFFFAQIKGRPFITIKYAQTIDGRIAFPGKRRYRISNSISRIYTHTLRKYHDAILVGIETVLTDDPLLNVRYIDGVSPLKVVLDSGLRIPPESRLIRNEEKGKVIIFTSKRTGKRKIEELIKLNIRVEQIDEQNGKLSLFQVAAKLKKSGINSILVEGGARVITSFIEDDLYDDLEICISPKILGAGIRATTDHFNAPLRDENQMRLLTMKSISNDVWLHYRRIKTIDIMEKI